QGLERRPLVDARDPARQLRPALRVRAEATVPEVHELCSDPGVGDRERLADEERAAAELALEVVEERRQLLVDRLLDRRLVAGLVQESRGNELLEEDPRADDVHERGVAILL